MKEEEARMAWNTAAVGTPHTHFVRSYEWGMFQQLLGREVIRINEDNIYAQWISLPLWFGKQYVYCPRGPWGEGEISRAFKPVASSFVHARIEPDSMIPIGQPYAIVSTLPVQPRDEWMLDLSQSKEELLSQMHQKTRYNIRLAERKGVQCKVIRSKDEASGEMMQAVISLFKKTGEHHQVRTHPAVYYRSLTKQFLSDGGYEIQPLDPWIRLYGGIVEKKLAAAVMVGGFGDTVSYLHGGSDVAYHASMASYVLHWKAICDAQELGYRWYNFGGIRPLKHHDVHPLDGVTRFKEGFGGFRLSYPGAYDVLFQKAWYQVYTVMRTCGRAIRRFQ